MRKLCLKLTDAKLQLSHCSCVCIADFEKVNPGWVRLLACVFALSAHKNKIFWIDKTAFSWIFYVVFFSITVFATARNIDRDVIFWNTR